ncbi:MAG TPA: fibronectin type III domain-containing protein [Terracidiphilus sp.]|nr:fibronectin type III domain-containing protein [Terracidiphilus sp.]
MSLPDNLDAWARVAAIAFALCGAGLSGCGTPGAPQPPSLNLPDPVTDLAAVRTGSQVTLTWTMPKRDTDKIVLESNVAVHVCREEKSGPCAAAGDVVVEPGASANFTDTLPAAAIQGTPRPLRYYVELRNRKGRSAGRSNAATVPAGEAPSPVTSLAAEVRKAGVVLGWQALDAHDSIRLHRTLLNPPAAKAKQDVMAAPPEPVEVNLLVDHDPGRALDKDIRFGQTYQYTAQRVARVDVAGKTYELAGPISAPVRIEALDVFPPAVPSGLAAVATSAEAGTPASIDLSWVPGTEADLAGYFVYRREAETPLRRISGDKPVIAPAFHDPQVQPGHSYVYSVSAVDQAGRESGRSAETQETVPQPR